MRLDISPQKADESGMFTFFTIIAIVAMLAVVVVLFTGVVSMARGGDFNARWGNRLMRWRVLLQAVAIGAMLLAIWAAKSQH